MNITADIDGAEALLRDPAEFDRLIRRAGNFARTNGACGEAKKFLGLVEGLYALATGRCGISRRDAYCHPWLGDAPIPSESH